MLGQFLSVEIQASPGGGPSLVAMGITAFDQFAPVRKLDGMRAGIAPALPLPDP